jgi:hypothetical protein
MTVKGSPNNDKVDDRAPSSPLPGTASNRGGVKKGRLYTFTGDKGFGWRKTEIPGAKSHDVSLAGSEASLVQSTSGEDDVPLLPEQRSGGLSYQ